MLWLNWIRPQSLGKSPICNGDPLSRDTGISGLGQQTNGDRPIYPHRLRLKYNRSANLMRCLLANAFRIAQSLSGTQSPSWLFGIRHPPNPSIWPVYIYEFKIIFNWFVPEFILYSKLTTTKNALRLKKVALKTWNSNKKMRILNISNEKYEN